jgi:hypothetical protein
LTRNGIDANTSASSFIRNGLNKKFCTIGYGHLIDGKKCCATLVANGSKEYKKFKSGVTKPEAVEMCNDDLKRIVKVHAMHFEVGKVLLESFCSWSTEIDTVPGHHTSIRESLMPIISFFRTLFIVGIMAAAPALSAAPTWAGRQDCQFIVPPDWRDGRVIWDGACAGGKAHGQGVLRGYRQGASTWLFLGRMKVTIQPE